MKNKSLIRAIKGQNPETIKEAANGNEKTYPLFLTIYHEVHNGLIYNEDESKYFESNEEVSAYYHEQYPGRELFIFNYYKPQMEE